MKKKKSDCVTYSDLSNFTDKIIAGLCVLLGAFITVVITCLISKDHFDSRLHKKCEQTHNEYMHNNDTEDSVRLYVRATTCWEIYREQEQE